MNPVVKDIIEEMEKHGETLSDIVSSTLTDEDMNDDHYFSKNQREGKISFTIWTKNRVYFPAIYDGWSWVESVSRNPDGVKVTAVGGI